jgi:DNA-binding IclR family transcriptional regulator
MNDNDIEDGRDKAVLESVGALAALEKELGGSPTVAEVAERTGYSNGAVHSYLREAAAKGLIVQRRGRFMTLEVARAFERKGKDK